MENRINGVYSQLIDEVGMKTDFKWERKAATGISAQ